ncbi:uncharacterized protein ColSpa_02587 [Colletotrichum spaethianum]|uniref:DUF7708 domain-containing protein n=1 Tax=Colletotrichum spaethianum TaxID=700344 RepID=A0AA37L611_9PEZI|nr:uncharacterized protein ColSpa_02587 [Colletotrichum spaethianum]GKT42406.1 hypothetical protein ColSpa_02587 [Colletotrichum spaethianum]
MAVVSPAILTTPADSAAGLAVSWEAYAKKCHRKAETAYKKAVRSLESYLNKEDAAAVISKGKDGKEIDAKEELHQVVRTIQQTKETKLEEGKTKKLIKCLDHYQGVFDILSQAEFSGLPLIWGGLKFILLVTKNNNAVLPKVIDVMIDIGRNLERIRGYAALYPTPRMLEFTAELYAAIVEFLEKVIKDAKNAEKNVLTIADNPTADVFQAIRKNLFKKFEVQAGFHQELQATYEVTTSKEWIEWFKMEQKYVPSGYSHETRVIQAECDAPDPQHALVWKKQQRKFASHVPSVYLIWTRGMTAQSAIASLIDQILVQKTEVMADAGIEMDQFKEANNSVKSLWNFFLYLTTVLGGCMVYITIGSVGDHEFGIVRKFVSMAKTWKGPPINVTLIHPFNDNFARMDDVVNLDDKYDVHPSLTTTDAMHHVLLLEINTSRNVSDTIQNLLWETAWREVRYAVIGIALTQVFEHIRLAAKKVGQEVLVTEAPFTESHSEHWEAAVAKWTSNESWINILREQIQRHIDIVDIHLPPDRKRYLEDKLELMVLNEDGEFGSKLSTAQRAQIWENLQDAIRPGTGEMFCSRIEELLRALLEDYRNASSGRNGETAGISYPLINTYFGKSGRWKDSFSEEQNLVADGITNAIEIGFGNLIQALASREDSA